MNDGALECITAPIRNARQNTVLIIARFCVIQWAYKRHAERDAAWYAVFFNLQGQAPIDVGMTTYSQKAVSSLVQDVMDVWDYIIENGWLK